MGLGFQPMANAYLSSPDDPEVRLPLHLKYCTVCHLVTLAHVVSPDVLFKNYLYLSSTSAVFQDHFRELAEKEVTLGRVTKDGGVVDIGSNDGIELRAFKTLHIPAIGVDPSVNVAAMANKEGLETLCEYFTEETADRILEKMKKVDLVTGTNVFAHVDNISQILKGVKKLIGNHGRFMIEVPHLLYMLQHNAFDLIYHEHLSYFFLGTLATLAEYHDLKIVEVQTVPTHGVSLRVYFGHKDLPEVNTGAINRILREEEAAFHSPLFHQFGNRVIDNKYKMQELLRKRLKGSLGKPVIMGYGAAAKTTVQFNWYELTRDEIQAVYDDSPAKQGKYVPGTNIPILAPPASFKGLTEYFYLSAWNFKESLKHRLKAGGFEGGYIVPFPMPYTQRRGS